MKQEFTKQNLLTGDIIVTRCGELGVVLAEKEYILYQNDGLDFYDMFTENLLSVDEDPKWDIIKVYRGEAISFYDYKDEEPIYEREDVEQVENLMSESLVMDKKMEIEAESSDEIFIIAQALYGNRTGMTMKTNNLDRLILGYTGDELEIREPVDRTIVKIPDTSNLVIIYNKYQEELELEHKEYLLKADNSVLKPLAFIPTERIEIFSRCIVCRMNENGELASLQHEDLEIIWKYLSE